MNDRIHQTAKVELLPVSVLFCLILNSCLLKNLQNRSNVGSFSLNDDYFVSKLDSKTLTT